MHVTAMPTPVQAGPVNPLSGLVGKCFMHPLIDYLLVGGGITIPIFAALFFFPSLGPINPPIYVFLLINGAHFAASTLRLYTKPGAKEEFPFLSWGFPVICLLAGGLGLYWPVLGRNLTALYFTWSPYHYAMQAYGLAVMYSMRSGARLEARDKTQIWLVCLLPFVYALLVSPDGGLSWFVSRQTVYSIPALAMVHGGLVGLVSIAVLALPFSLFWQLHNSRGKNVPLIALLLQFSNGIWWLTTDYLSAFWWTTAFHSIQYLIIVVVLHVKDQMARENVKLGRFHTPLFHGAWFYALSFVLAGLLFFIVPLAAYVPLGFEAPQAILMMTVVINLHHFIVDGFIWRNKPAKPAVPAQQSVAIAV